MKSVIALAAAFTLAACATADKATSVSASAQAGTLYCWKDKLVAQGDNMVCNWDKDRRDACNGTYIVTINKSRVSTGPTDAGRCENGQWLVMVTMR